MARDSRIFAYLVILGIATFLWTWLVAGFGPRPISMRVTLAYNPPNGTSGDGEGSSSDAQGATDTLPPSTSRSVPGSVVRSASVSSNLSNLSSGSLLGNITAVQYSQHINQGEAFQVCNNLGKNGVLFSPTTQEEINLANSLIDTNVFKAAFRDSAFAWIGLFSGALQAGYYWRYGSEEAKVKTPTVYSSRLPVAASSRCNGPCPWATGYPNISDFSTNVSVLLNLEDLRWYSVDGNTSAFNHNTILCQYPPISTTDGGETAPSATDPLLDPSLHCDIMYAPNIWTDSYARPEQVGGMRNIFLDHVVSNGSTFTPPWRNGPTCGDFLQFPWIKFLIGVPVIGLLALAAPPLNIGKRWFPMLGFTRGMAISCATGMIGYLIILPQLAMQQCSMRINEEHLEHANLLVVKYHDAEIHPLPYGSAIISTAMVIFTLLCLICCPRAPQDERVDVDDDGDMEGFLLEGEARDQQKEERLREERIEAKRARLPKFLRAMLPDRKKHQRRAVEVDDPNDPLMQELRESENDRVWKRKNTTTLKSDGGRKRGSTISASPFAKPPTLKQAYVDLESYTRNLEDCSPFSLAELPETPTGFDFDPRTRLPLVGIPPVKSRPFFKFSKSPIHSFCNGFLVSGGGQRKQRVIVASDVCLYICQTSGAIERCVPFENIRHIGLGGKDQRIVFRYEGKNDPLKCDFGSDQEVCLELENLQTSENLLKITDRCQRRLTGNLRPNMLPKLKTGKNHTSLIKVDRVDRIPSESVEEAKLPDSGNVAINPEARQLGQLLEALRVFADRKEQVAEEQRQQEMRRTQRDQQETAQLPTTFVDMKNKPGLASTSGSQERNSPEKGGVPMFGTATVFVHISEAGAKTKVKSPEPISRREPLSRVPRNTSGLPEAKKRDLKKNTHSFFVAPSVFDDERERRPELAPEEGADVEDLRLDSQSRYESHALETQEGNDFQEDEEDGRPQDHLMRTTELTLKEKLFGKDHSSHKNSTTIDPFSDDDTL